jgi:hypothetical protein
LFGFFRNGLLTWINHELTTTIFTLTFGFTIMSGTILYGMMRTTTGTRGVSLSIGRALFSGWLIIEQNFSEPKKDGCEKSSHQST